MSVTTAGAPPRQATGPTMTTTMSPADQRYRTMQTWLFGLGATLMPLGVIIVCVGWYGAAHTTYAYDQTPYLLSGGSLGVAVSQLGGFLYFGAWLAKGAQDQRLASKQIADTMLVLADVVSRQKAEAANPALAQMSDPGAVPVLAGPQGTTVHRRDCALIRHREDLRVLAGTEGDVSECRVCNPTVV